MTTPKRISLISIAILIAATLIAGPAFLTGCGSATQTAYVGEVAATSTLQVIAGAYKSLKANGIVLSAADDTKFRSLYVTAKQADIIATEATEAAAGIGTNSPSITAAVAQAAAASALADLVAFAKSVGLTF